MGCSPSHERPLDCPGEFLSIGEATRGWRRLAAGCPLRAGDQVALVISTITDHESVRDPHVPSFRQAVSCWWVAGKTETYEKNSVPSTQEMVRDPDYWIYIKQLYLAVDDLARGKMERDYGWWILREQVMQKGRNPFQMAEDGFRSISFTKVYQDNLLGRAMHYLNTI